MTILRMGQRFSRGLMLCSVSTTAMTLGLAVFAANPAQAACTGSTTAGDDIIECTTDGAPPDGGTGNDTLILNAGSYTGGDINLDQGNDFIDIRGDVNTLEDLALGISVSPGNEDPQGGNNVFQVIGHTLNVNGVLSGGVVSPNFNGVVGGGEYLDEFIITNSTVQGRFDLNNGNDIIRITNSTVAQQTGNVRVIEGENGSDFILIESGSVIGRADQTNNVLIDGGNDGDRIEINNSTVHGRIDMGNGDNDNSLAITAGFTGTAGAAGESISVTEVVTTGGLYIANSTVNGTNNTISGGTGNDYVEISGTSSIAEDINLFGGEDEILISGTTNVGGGVDMGVGNDIFGMSGGTVTGLVDLGTGDDTVNLSGTVTIGALEGADGVETIDIAAGTTVNFTDASGLGALVPGEVVDLGTDGDTLSVSGTINALIGGIYQTVSLGGGEDTFNLDGGTLDANLDTGSDNDIINLNSGTVNGQVFGSDTVGDVFNVHAGVTLNNGLGSALPVRRADEGDVFNIYGGTINANTLDTSEADGGNAIFAGSGPDEVGLFGGTINGEINLGDGLDTLVIDFGGDEFAANPDLAGTGLTAPAGATGPLNLASPRFNGDAGEDSAYIYDLDPADDLIFESFNDVNMFGQAFSLDNTEVAGEQQNTIDNLNLFTDAGGVHSTFRQTDGDLIIRNEAGGSRGDLRVQTNNTVTMVDGVADDSITVQIYAPESGSILEVDTNPSLQTSDVLTVTSVDRSNITAGSPVLVDTRIIGGGAVPITGSIAIVDDDGRVDPAVPSPGDTLTPSEDFVFLNDPSSAARSYFLVDEGGSTNGVFLQWVTPASGATAGGAAAAAAAGAGSAGAAIGGAGNAVLAAISGPNLPGLPETPRLSDPERPVDETDPYGDPTGRQSFAGACADSTAAWIDLSAYRTDRDAVSSGGQTFAGYDTTGYGITVGGDIDLGGSLIEECGKVRVGAFASYGMASVSVEDGSSADVTSTMGGIYATLRQDEFYAMGMLVYGQLATEASNALLGATSEEDATLFGGLAAIGKQMALSENTFLDARLSAQMNQIEGAPYKDSMGLEFETNTVSQRYEASLGLVSAGVNELGQRVTGELRAAVIWDMSETEVGVGGLPVTNETEDLLLGLSARFTTQLTDSAKLYGRVATEFGDTTSTISGSAGIRFTF